MKKLLLLLTITFITIQAAEQRTFKITNKSQTQPIQLNIDTQVRPMPGILGLSRIDTIQVPPLNSNDSISIIKTTGQIVGINFRILNMQISLTPAQISQLDQITTGKTIDIEFSGSGDRTYDIKFTSNGKSQTFNFSPDIAMGAPKVIGLA